jgi:hypothetical protein
MESPNMTYLHDDLQGQAGRAAAADERGDLVPVDLVGDGFGDGPGIPSLTSCRARQS